MKAKFFFLGLCALALAACSIDEVSQVNDTNAIQFKATTATRATVNTTNNLQEFTVWAWNDSNLFMDHVTATKQSNGTFTTSPYYFWPTGTVDFYALAPVALDDYGVSGTTGDELAYIGGSITVDEGDLEDDSDDHPVYTGNVATADIDEDNITIEAYIPGKPEDQVDIIYAIAKDKSSGSVAMNFRHALSQVAFKASDINTDFVVDVAEVSICSVNRHGTFTLNKVASTTDWLSSDDIGTDDITSSQGVWSGVDHKTRFTSSNADEGSYTGQTLATDGTVVDLTSDPLLLIPQQVAAWDPDVDYSDSELGSYIRVLCHVTEHGSTLWPNDSEKDVVEVNGTDYAYIAMPVEVDWEQGYKYTYTIVFGNGLGYYPPDDANTDLEGTPVLVPITFKVTVDEFQDAGNKDVPTDTDITYIKVSTAEQLAGAAHMGYQTIEVEEDSSITLDGYLEFTHDCTLILGEDSTITGPDATDDCYIDHNGNSGYTSIIYVNGCNLIIEGEGTVQTGGSNDSDYTNAIWVVNGTVTIYGGTYKGSNWSGEVSSNYVKQAVYCGEGGYAYIYDGDFYAGKSTHPASVAGDDGYAWVLNCHNSSWEEGHAMIYCYGGTYHDGFDPADLHVDDADSYVADGYSSVDNGDDTYTVVKTTVTTGVELWDAINAGASEVTVSGTVTLNDGTSNYLILNNDCTINIPEGSELLTSDISGSVPGLYITGGTTTLTGSGTITYDEEAFPDPDSSQNYYTIWLSGGNVVIDGDLTFVGESHTVYAQKGFAYIYNGSFINNSPTSDGSYWVLNCQDTNYKNGTANIYCYGGRYYQFDPANNTSEGTGTNFVVEGYESVYDADTEWYTVVEKQ